MKPFVKLLVLFTILFFQQSPLFAQLRITPATSIVNDLKKVIEDYPSHFDHLLGELIMQNPQSADYTCNFKVNGAEECSITRYTGKKKAASWQAVMLTTESFEDAKKKFKSLFGQINQLAIRSMRLKGVYDTPVEEKKFSSVLFYLDPSDPAVSKLRVELVLEAEQMDWKVKLLIYDREREDEERGEVIE
ncbi:MAG: hypothetical protein H7Y42_06390 [Chitinophagaceae bacterium]|nr:hypothetical protein [Chitinophagaceae bacterium]